MQYTFLGSTGLRVSDLALGTMTFGDDWGWGADEATSRTVLDAFLDAGGNFVDTADIYTGSTSETLLGRFLKGRRDRVVVATKYSISTDQTDPNAGGNQRKNFTRSLEASLRRLGTDYIDLYWSHVWDGLTPVEETLRAMDDAVRAGKVLHIGFSDYPAWLTARADALAEVSRTVRPAAIQLEYSLAKRDAERELLPMAESLGLGVLAWSPLAGGVLTGKRLQPANPIDAPRLARADAVAHFAQYHDDRTAEITREVIAVADELDASPAQVAIAWVRHRSPLHIPIIGARTLAQLADNLAAAALYLPEQAQARLDRVSAINRGFPLDFLKSGQTGWFGDESVRRLDIRRPRAGHHLLGLA